MKRNQNIIFFLIGFVLGVVAYIGISSIETTSQAEINIPLTPPTYKAPEPIIEEMLYSDLLDKIKTQSRICKNYVNERSDSCLVPTKQNFSYFEISTFLRFPEENEIEYVEATTTIDDWTIIKIYPEQNKANLFYYIYLDYFTNLISRVEIYNSETMNRHGTVEIYEIEYPNNYDDGNISNCAKKDSLLCQIQKQLRLNPGTEFSLSKTSKFKHKEQISYNNQFVNVFLAEDNKLVHDEKTFYKDYDIKNELGKSKCENSKSDYSLNCFVAKALGPDMMFSRIQSKKYKYKVTIFVFDEEYTIWISEKLPDMIE